MEELKAKVVSLLVTEYDMTMEEAEESVNESYETKHQSLWHENSDPESLAKLLASDDEDD